jgi:hypothetical protein
MKLVTSRETRRVAMLGVQLSCGTTGWLSWLNPEWRSRLQFDLQLWCNWEYWFHPCWIWVVGTRHWHFWRTCRSSCPSSCLRQGRRDAHRRPACLLCHHHMDCQHPWPTWSMFPQKVRTLWLSLLGHTVSMKVTRDPSRCTCPWRRRMICSCGQRRCSSQWHQWMRMRREWCRARSRASQVSWLSWRRGR